MQSKFRKISETKDWLFKRKNGKGGFERNSRALDNFGGAPEHTTNAYILWAMVQAGTKAAEIEKELAYVYDLAVNKHNKDSYFVSLVCNLFAQLELHDKSNELAQKLVNFQNEGKIADAETSITRSGGKDLLMESTSVAVLAWLSQKDLNKFVENIERAITWIRKNCSGGSFGSTQATVLALKAIVTHESRIPNFPGEGSIVIRIDGTEVSSEGFDKTTKEALNFRQFGEKIKTGKHTLEVEMLAGCKMPFSFLLEYNTKSFETSKECKVALSTKLRQSDIKQGEATEVEVQLKNLTSEGIPMTIAIIGLPGGMEARIDSLKELVKTEKVAYYELFGAREIVLYWRALAPDQQVTLTFDVIAAVPGKYTGPASRAYLYYTQEFKAWVPSLTANIAPI